MMPVVNDSDKAYLGSTEVEKIYLGTNLIYQNQLSLLETLLSYNPVGLWRLEEADTSITPRGSVALPLSLASSPGVLLQNIAGPDGLSYPKFTAAQGLSTVTDNNAWSINFTTGFTVFVSFKPGVLTGTQTVICKAGGEIGTAEWTLRLVNINGSGLRIWFHLWYNGTSDMNGTREATAKIMATSSWNSAMVRYPAAAQSTTTACRIYTNSVIPSAVTQLPGSAANNINTSSAITVAQRGYGDEDLTDGSIGIIGIFNSALIDLTCETIMQAAITEGWVPPAKFFGEISMYREIWVEDPARTDLVTIPDHGTANAALTNVGGNVGYHPTGLNGKPAFDFTADSSHCIRTTTGTLSAEFTVFHVFYLTSLGIHQTFGDGGTSPSRAFVAAEAGGTYNVYNDNTVTASGGTVTASVPHIIMAHYKNNATKLYVDGINVVTDSVCTPSPVTGFAIGGNFAASSGCMNGYMAYSGMYSGDLTAHAGYPAWLAAVKTYYGIA